MNPMVRRSPTHPSNGTLSTRRHSSTTTEAEHPKKKVKHLLVDESSTSDPDDSSGGAPLPAEALDNILTINEGFAKRFEHNKRREELHKRM